MNIRLERPEDYRDVEELTREAFNEFEAKFPPKEKKHQEGQIVDDCTMNPNGI